jgi:DNA-binding GntR family transcriptional regulator
VVDLRHLTELLGRSGAGLSAPALAKQTTASVDQIRGLLKDLEAAGKVRRTGHRRGTRWHVITDEDWIAQRAAELAARTKEVLANRKAA